MSGITVTLKSQRTSLYAPEVQTSDVQVFINASKETANPMMLQLEVKGCNLAPPFSHSSKDKGRSSDSPSIDIQMLPVEAPMVPPTTIIINNNNNNNNFFPTMMIDSEGESTDETHSLDKSSTSSSSSGSGSFSKETTPPHNAYSFILQQQKQQQQQQQQQQDQIYLYRFQGSPENTTNLLGITIEIPGKKSANRSFCYAFRLDFTMPGARPMRMRILVLRNTNFGNVKRKMKSNGMGLTDHKNEFTARLTPLDGQYPYPAFPTCSVEALYDNETSLTIERIYKDVNPAKQQSAGILNLAVPHTPLSQASPHATPSHVSNFSGRINFASTLGPNQMPQTLPADIPSQQQSVHYQQPHHNFQFPQDDQSPFGSPFSGGAGGDKSQEQRLRSLETSMDDVNKRMTDLESAMKRFFSMINISSINTGSSGNPHQQSFNSTNQSLIDSPSGSLIRPVPSMGAPINYDSNGEYYQQQQFLQQQQNFQQFGTQQFNTQMNCGGASSSMQFQQTHQFQQQQQQFNQQHFASYDGSFSDTHTSYNPGGADFGEWFKAADTSKDAVPRPGDIVSLVKDHKISLKTHGDFSTDDELNPLLYAVCTTRQGIVCNLPNDVRERSKGSVVAFVGQTHIRVRVKRLPSENGEVKYSGVKAGAIIVPSGFNDGTGVVGSRDNKRFIVGIALESSDKIMTIAESHRLFPRRSRASPPSILFDGSLAPSSSSSSSKKSGQSMQRSSRRSQSSAKFPAVPPSLHSSSSEPRLSHLPSPSSDTASSVSASASDLSTAPSSNSKEVPMVFVTEPHSSSSPSSSSNNNNNNNGGGKSLSSSSPSVGTKTTHEENDEDTMIVMVNCFCFPVHRDVAEVLHNDTIFANKIDQNLSAQSSQIQEDVKHIMGSYEEPQSSVNEKITEIVSEMVMSVQKETIVPMYEQMKMFEELMRDQTRKMESLKRGMTLLSPVLPSSMRPADNRKTATPSLRKQNTASGIKNKLHGPTRSRRASQSFSNFSDMADHISAYNDEVESESETDSYNDSPDPVLNDPSSSSPTPSSSSGSASVSAKSLNGLRALDSYPLPNSSRPVFSSPPSASSTLQVPTSSSAPKNHKATSSPSVTLNVPSSDSLTPRIPIERTPPSLPQSKFKKSS
eukprot:TRINITY_DN33_c0_g2_i1.p1 TRINITY_DN33_c0_g2~~TRINITY_DN33_c0_g2_i1.p1  ORF type:complete len:1133 (-),score=588.95 TRINITY_DN33_c0_g2_i1:119-3517(-)